MKSEQVDQALYQKFVTEQQRIVFWHDVDGEFADYLASGLPNSLATVKVIHPKQIGGLSTKLLLEQEDTKGQYLVYSQGEKPTPEQDFLLDIRLYSAQFYADIASLWLQELGLASLYLREHLRTRSAFLNSQERRRKLKALLNPNDDEISIDRKMIAVLVGAPEATPQMILRSLCHSHLQEEAFPLAQPPEALELLSKMSLINAFWDAIALEFSYAPDSPNLADLLRRLFISEVLSELPDHSIPALDHYRLPEPGLSNAKIFLSQWRDSHRNAKSYDAAASAIAAELNIVESLRNLPANALAEIPTFFEIEALLLSALKQTVLQERQTVDLDSLSLIVKQRQTGHWLLTASENTPDPYAKAQAYEAIIAAAELFHFHNRFGDRLQFSSPESLLKTYCTELYQYDYLYRRFCTAARYSHNQGWDLLKTLETEIENLYTIGFIQPLGLTWSRLLDQGFLEQWSLPTLPPQQDFYRKVIQPYLDKSERKRAFVIISDAFRYEAGQELMTVLNGRYRLQAEICPLLGVLPSYTDLGMASLLPHQTLSYDSKGDVLVDGKSSQSTEDRQRILNTFQGLACLAKDLRRMKKEEARQFIEGKRVVYIYHDVIDYCLDGDSKESGSFEVVSDCISELAELTQFCMNTLNASKVWITADHGFLFQQTLPDATDKSQLRNKPEGTLKTNKRYLIGSRLGSVPEVHLGQVATTAGAEGTTEFWIPRGANRFHFVGGSRFIHGGAMPQEVIVPLLTVTQLRGTSAQQSKVEKVSIQALGTSFKITTPKHRFEFIQTESVGDRRKPLIVKVAVYEGTKPVTSIETLTFDSDSEQISDRKKSVLLELGSGPFDKTTAYRLVLRDVETDAEVLTLPVIIDRSFEDDF